MLLAVDIKQCLGVFDFGTACHALVFFVAKKLNVFDNKTEVEQLGLNKSHQRKAIFRNIHQPLAQVCFVVKGIDKLAKLFTMWKKFITHTLSCFFDVARIFERDQNVFAIGADRVRAIVYQKDLHVKVA